MAGSRTETCRVLLAQSGDREALSALLDGIQKPLFGYLIGLVRDRHLAEDLLQDVFVQVCRKLVWLREPEVFRPWVFRIASRAASRRLRQRGRSEQSLDTAELADLAAPETTPEIDSVAMVNRIRALIPTVSLSSRAVLILHYVEGLSLDEVAAILDVPTGTVKSRLAYGLATIRRKLTSVRRAGSDANYEEDTREPSPSR
jgi:RNA polymerase sigma-70 factor, ECF subfamily